MKVKKELDAASVESQAKLALLIKEKGYAYVIQAIVHEDELIPQEERESIKNLVLSAAKKDDIREVLHDPELLA